MIDLVDVPIFFILSGYLSRKQPVKRYFMKKIMQLIVPFFFFTTLKLILNLSIGSFSHSENVIGEFVIAYLNGEYYWFSYCLFIMMLISPLLWKLKKKTLIFAWIVSTIIYFIASLFGWFSVGGGMFQLINVLRYFPWFLGGYILKCSGFPFEKRLVRIILLGISIIYSIIGVVTCWTGHMNYHINELLLSVTFFYIMYSVFSITQKGNSILELVSKYSYQIFFLDSFVKIILFAMVGKITSITSIMVMLIVVLNIFISVAICVIVSRIKYLKVLFGI